MRTSSLSPADRARISDMRRAGASTKTIATALGRDPRTIRSALRRLGFVVSMGRPAPQTPRARTVPLSPVVPPPTQLAVDGEPMEVDSRPAAARGRLWDVLMDPNSPGQAVVQAFNALAESEGWGSAPPKPLPEPVNEAEVLDRWADLFDAYAEPTQRALLKRLSGVLSTAP